MKKKKELTFYIVCPERQILSWWRRHRTVAEAEGWLNTFVQSAQLHEPMCDIPQPNEHIWPKDPSHVMT